MNCQDTMVLHGKEDIFVEIYAKIPADHPGRRPCFPACIAQICKMLGFHITVMDDKKELQQGEISEADCLITGSFEDYQRGSRNMKMRIV
ncbi:MAG: hypothetical protein ACLUTA_13100 [Blautia wexlerae]